MSENNTPSLFDRWRNLSTQQFRPLQASLELTNRCNERCTHCYIPDYSDDPKRTLSPEQWNNILLQLREAGVLYLILMGGEAMLNPHFWSISEEGQRLGFSLAMITNGLLINEKTAKRLSSVGFADLTISLYSLNPSIHDKMTRVYGSCERTKKAIQYCIDQGIRVHINCLLTDANIDGYFDLVSWCIDRKINIKFDPLITPKFGGDLSPTTLRAQADKLRQFYFKHIDLYPESAPSPSTEIKTDYLCNAAKGKCAVTAYGELLTCIEVREPLGDLTKQKFAEIWEGSVAQKWRNFKFADLKNADPNNISFCDHCPGMAMHESGDPMQISDYAKTLANIKLEAHRYAKSKNPGGSHEKTREITQKDRQEEILLP